MTSFVAIERAVSTRGNLKNFWKSSGHIAQGTLNRTIKFLLTLPIDALYNQGMSNDLVTLPSRRSEDNRPADSLPVAAQSKPVMSRDEIIRKLSSQLPYNAVGFAKGYYRTDLIPPEVAREDLQDVLDSAYVDLCFDEGYPAFIDGRPFWHRMDQEPTYAFEVYKLYLELGELGTRSLDLLLEKPEVLHFVKIGLSLQAQYQSGDSVSDSDSEDASEHRPADSQPLVLENDAESVYKPWLPQVAGSAIDVTSVEGQRSARMMLVRWFHEFYWRERTKSYDVYKAAAYRHLRARRAITAEDQHYLMANELLLKMKQYFTKEDFMNEMTPKVALDAFKMLVSIMRESTGLATAGGKGGGGEGGHGGSNDFELILRQVAVNNKQSGGGSQVVDESGRLIPSNDTLLRDVLSDPSATHSMQELIIRMSQGKAGGGHAKPNDFGDDNDSIRDELGL